MRAVRVRPSRPLQRGPASGIAEAMGLTRLLRRTHNLLALIVGAQVLLWVVSGLFFALRPIEEVRGEHLRAA